MDLFRNIWRKRPSRPTFQAPLAQTFMPPPAHNFSIAGGIEFNTGKNWGGNNGLVGGLLGLLGLSKSYDMPTVALHEIGHGLGLYHSTVSPSAVMYASYTGVK